MLRNGNSKRAVHCFSNYVKKAVKHVLPLMSQLLLESKRSILFFFPTQPLSFDKEQNTGGREQVAN